jgi:hypothetical protein
MIKGKRDGTCLQIRVVTMIHVTEAFLWLRLVLDTPSGLVEHCLERAVSQPLSQTHVAPANHSLRERHKLP